MYHADFGNLPETVILSIILTFCCSNELLHILHSYDKLTPTQ